MTTMLGADKWYWGDKISGPVRTVFQHLKNQEEKVSKTLQMAER